MSLSALARRHTTDHFRAVLNGLLAVEGSLFTGESLADDSGVSSQDQVLAGRIVSAIAPDRRS